jgi:hypothetical protein
MFIFYLSSDVYDETLLNFTRYFIKFIVNDSLNLRKMIVASSDTEAELRDHVM